ncbi:MAG TPA: hypothetical protein VMA53_28115 [Stellaceae bacterium]|nr:hypothetical protein [Stellaceae bacterium]
MNAADRPAAAAPGMLAVWTDIDPALEADFNEWYWREHLPERVAIPGFRWGRRYRALSGEPHYFACYELDGIETLASPAYLARLNQPTPWTARVMRGFHNTVRAGFEIAASRGEVSGAVLLSLRFSPRPDKTAELDSHVRESLLPALQARPGIVRAQHWRARAIAAPQTVEARLRRSADTSADGAVIIEAATTEDLAAAESDLAASPLAGWSATPIIAATYGFLCSLG